MIPKAHKYLYYRIYSWNLRTWSESDGPEYNALFGMSFLALLNIVSILTTIEMVTGGSVFNDSGMGKLLCSDSFSLLLSLVTFP